jgi:hypothetical protein
MANSDVKLSETIEFLTQIHTSWDNNEQRAAIRTRPRRSISYEYIGTETRQSQYLRSLVYAQQTQMFQIPLWHAGDRTEQKIYQSQAMIKLNPENIWQWRGCSGCNIWVNDRYGGTYYPLVGFTASGEVGLGKQFDVDVEKGTVGVMPVAWGVLSQSDSYVNMTGSVTALNINVELMREAEAPILPTALDPFHNEAEPVLYGKNLPVEHNGYELFLKSPNWVNNMNAKFSRNANRLDNQSGSFLYDLKSAAPTETRELEYALFSRVEINNLQRFFTRMKGRAHSFYAPTWLADIELVEPGAAAGATTLTTKFPLYWKYYANNSRRKKAIVFFKDGTAQILDIAGYSTDITGEFGKIMLDKPLAYNLTTKNIFMISFLCQYRMDNDVMVTNYESVHVANTAFTLMEVNQ